MGMSEFLHSRHPAKTAEQVEAASGISARTVAKWLAGETEPKGRHLVALIGAYGPELLAAMFKHKISWLETSVFAEREKAIDERIAALHRDRNSLRR